MIKLMSPHSGESGQPTHFLWPQNWGQLPKEGISPFRANICPSEQTPSLLRPQKLDFISCFLRVVLSVYPNWHIDNASINKNNNIKLLCPRTYLQPKTVMSNNKSLMLPPLCENGKSLSAQLKLPYLSWVELSTNQCMSICLSRMCP